MPARIATTAALALTISANACALTSEMERALQEFENRLTAHIVNTDPAIQVDKAGSGDAYTAFLAVCSSRELAGRQAQFDDFANAYIVAIHAVDLMDVLLKTLPCAEGSHFRKYDKGDIADRARAYNAKWQEGSELHASRAAKWEEGRAVREKRQEKERAALEAQERKRLDEVKKSTEAAGVAKATKVKSRQPAEADADMHEAGDDGNEKPSRQPASKAQKSLLSAIVFVVAAIGGLVSAVLAWRLYPVFFQAKIDFRYLTPYERFRERVKFVFTPFTGGAVISGLIAINIFEWFCGCTL